MPAPVGMLCRECARGKPSHLYQIDPKLFALAIPVTLAAAFFGGWLVATVRGIGFFGMFAGFLYGMAVGEVALRTASRKRGWQMETMAGVSVFLGLLGGYVIHYLAMTAAIPHQALPPDADVPMMSAASVAMMFLMDPWMYVTIGVAVFGAVTRVRNIG